MKTALLVLLSLASWPVGSASADTISDTLIVNGTSFFLSESAEAAGGGIVVNLATPPNPNGGVVLTENRGTFASDVLFFSHGKLIMQSETGGSVGFGSTSGFTFLKESGQLQNVGAAFGLAPGAIQIRSGSPTPLPATWTIMLTGLIGLGVMLY